MERNSRRHQDINSILILSLLPVWFADKLVTSNAQVIRNEISQSYTALLVGVWLAKRVWMCGAMVLGGGKGLFLLLRWISL